jgi:hypothetical protein
MLPTIILISIYIIWILILLYLYLFYIVDFEYNQSHSFLYLLFDFKTLPSILVLNNYIMTTISFRILVLILFKI